MIDAEIEVRRAGPGPERDAALALRERVFVGEQGVSREEELDGRDAEAVHIVALLDGEVVGTCRLLVEGDTVKLARMAVAPESRGRGVGGALLVHSDEVARGLGARRIVLHSQAHAVGLYAAAGFRATGEPFLDAGIEHVSMERELDPAAASDKRDRISTRGDRA